MKSARGIAGVDHQRLPATCATSPPREVEPALEPGLPLMADRHPGSAFLQGRLKQAGFENVVNVAEGMIGGRRGIGWINSGLPLRRWTPGLDRPHRGAN